MGGKQSVQNPSTGSINVPFSYSRSSSGVSSTRSRNEAGSAQNMRNRRRTTSGPGLSQRLERAHSSMESEALHIPSHRSETANQETLPDTSSSSEESRSSRMLSWLQRRSQPNITQSLPQYFYKRDAVCAMCRKLIPAEDIEVHFVMCITKPRVSYNEDILSIQSGECAICLDLMEKGDIIARLPCLCIYHKPCIQEWFKKNQTCPEHPPD